jgi:diguanylate cyclase (GGDEF)-like protein
MKSIRNEILKCLEEYDPDNEKELIVALNHIVDRKGKQVYAIIFEVLANLNLNYQEAEEHWHRIIAHCREMSSTLRRRVSIRTAMFDYLSSVNRALKNPKIVEINHFEKTAMLSKYDSLTGLLNRHSFEELFSKEISRAERHNKDLSVLFFDLDDFKRINDYYGHIAGDNALKQVAQIILEEKRDEDIAARYGGEELVVILPETGKVNTLVVGERIRERVDALRLEHHGAKIRLTISGGLASFPFDATEASNLLNDADTALRRAKEAGKNAIVLFSPDKRRFARRPFKNEILAKEVAFDGIDVDVISGKNISISGMRILTRQSLNVGTKLQLHIPFKAEGPPHLIVGSVKRVKPTSADHYEIGVSFLEVDKLTRNEILCYLLRNQNVSSLGIPQTGVLT